MNLDDKPGSLLHDRCAKVHSNEMNKKCNQTPSSTHHHLDLLLSEFSEN